MKRKHRQTREKHYYDVELFRKVYLETLGRRGRLGRIFGRFTAYLDSVQGFFIPMLGLPLFLGTFVAVIVGASYGPLVFLAILGSLIGSFVFLVDRKVGQSLQFGEYKIWTRTLAQVVAFFMVLGVIFFLVFVSRLTP